MKVVLLVLLGSLGVFPCKPGPGSSCDPREARCLDPKRAIACEDGKFFETPCRGKAGCSTVQERTSCDISGNQPGDVCSKNDEGVAVCAAADAMLAFHLGWGSLGLGSVWRGAQPRPSPLESPTRRRHAVQCPRRSPSSARCAGG